MGCCQNLVKYTLFVTNLLVFILGLVTLGFGIWVLVDKPSFLNLFDDAQSILNDHGIDSGFDLGVYAGAPIVLIVFAVIVSIIAFFGCCGAIKENKCMLITYFVILLAIMIGMIVGAVLVLQGKFDEQIKNPLLSSMKYYKDDPKSATPDEGFKAIWNTVQTELKCCGVDNADDWSSATDAGWTVQSKFPKPEGCCKFTRGSETGNTDAQIQTCREANYDMNSTYYFNGCYTVFISEIESHQDKIFGVSIATIVIMVVNMLSAFALCTMAE